MAVYLQNILAKLHKTTDKITLTFFPHRISRPKIVVFIVMYTIRIALTYLLIILQNYIVSIYYFGPHIYRTISQLKLHTLQNYAEPLQIFLKILNHPAIFFSQRISSPAPICLLLIILQTTYFSHIFTEQLLNSNYHTKFC